MTETKRDVSTPRSSGKSWVVLLLGLIVGGGGAVLFVVLVGMPLALGHRNDFPLERVYGDMAVSLAVKLQAGSAQNPYSQNLRAIEAGRLAYTGSCSVCHGANGDGKGVFGQAIYPPATDLRAHDTQGKSDAELFWIIKNGLSFAGMPGFGQQYNDQAIWSLVSYTHSLANSAGASPAQLVPTATSDQLAMADPRGDAVQRGAATFFASGCHTCHGAAGDAPGELRLREGGREVAQVIRRGRPGMPAYGPNQITDAQLTDLQAFVSAIAPRR